LAFGDAGLRGLLTPARQREVQDCRRSDQRTSTDPHAHGNGIHPLDGTPEFVIFALSRCPLFVRLTWSISGREIAIALPPGRVSSMIPELEDSRRCSNDHSSGKQP
jgi:hypothetical protein